MPHGQENSAKVADEMNFDRRRFLTATSLIPILGPRTPEQLKGSLSALDVKLSSEQLARLDEVSAVALGTPHEQITGSAARIAGGKPELLEMRSVPVP
jgi:hypothetical protein